jgi:Domain of unknown function (DUF4190)
VSDFGRTASDPLPPGAVAPPPVPLPPVPPPTPGSTSPYVVAQRTNGLAITSMVLGIVWIYWIGSILAVVFGHIALSQIKQSTAPERGRGMAIAGLVLGYVGIAVLVAVVAVVATVDFDDDPSGASCRSDALDLSIAENAYHVAHGTYVPESDLVATNHLSEETELHDVVILDGGADYRIVPTGGCAISRNVLATHSSQRNQRAAASGAATAQTSSTASSPVGNAFPGVSTARTVSESAAAGSALATVSIAPGSFASG